VWCASGDDPQGLLAFIEGDINSFATTLTGVGLAGVAFLIGELTSLESAIDNQMDSLEKVFGAAGGILALAGWPGRAAAAFTGALVINLLAIQSHFDSMLGREIQELKGVQNAVLNGGDAWAKNARFVVQEAPDPNAGTNTFVFGMLNIPTPEWMSQTLTLTTELPPPGE
jgi:hypothetical protein